MASEKNVTRWATAISTHKQNGRKIIFRFAQEFTPQFDRASQPDRIILTWKYHSGTGQPSSDEHARMDLLEDALGAVLFEEEFATLALVSTGENLREWIYYARSEDEFMDRLNRALAGELFPIEIHAAADPSWESYEAFRTGVKGL
jgi:hypothetical protein